MKVLIFLSFQPTSSVNVSPTVATDRRFVDGLPSEDALSPSLFVATINQCVHHLGRRRRRTLTAKRGEGERECEAVSICRLTRFKLYRLKSLGFNIRRSL